MTKNSAQQTRTSQTETNLVSVTYNAPVGALRLVASNHGLRAILWPNDTHERRRVRLGQIDEGSSPVLAEAARQLDQYFAGGRMDFDVDLDLCGTEFQVQIWRGLADIKYGRTTTYGEQAAAIGNPKATRAVASANGKNPISIMLPCHRIIGADGSLTGFAGGLEGKAWLLDHERRNLGMEPKWSSNTLF